MGRILERALSLTSLLTLDITKNGVISMIFVYFMFLISCFGLFVFGSADGDQRVDSLYRIFFHYPGRYFRNGVGYIFGQRGEQVIDAIYDYIFESNNCLIQLMYVLLVAGINASTVFIKADEMVLQNDYVGAFILVVLPSICFAIFMFVSLSDPGVIENPDDLLMAEVYWTRDLNLHPMKICRTHLWVRPARSRHCSKCKVCVMKHDHHCPWIGNCVGPLNYGLFHLFLWANTVMCTVYSVWQFFWFKELIHKRNLWNLSFVAANGNRYKATYFRIFEYLMSRHMVLTINWICAATFAFACSILVLQSLHVIVSNKTVAENSTFGCFFRNTPWTYHKGIRTNILEVFTISKDKLLKHLQETRKNMGDEKFTQMYITPLMDFINESQSTDDYYSSEDEQKLEIAPQIEHTLPESIKKK